MGWGRGESCWSLIDPGTLRGGGRSCQEGAFAGALWAAPPRAGKYLAVDSSMGLEGPSQREKTFGRVAESQPRTNVSVWGREKHG